MNKKLVTSVMLMAILGTSAFTFADVVNDNDSDFEVFKASHIQRHQERLEEKVADGIMSQEEADEIIKTIELRMENCDEETYSAMHGSGQRRGFGNGEKRGFGNGKRRGFGMRQSGCHY